jgi:hypothetical protein
MRATIRSASNSSRISGHWLLLALPRRLVPLVAGKILPDLAEELAPPLGAAQPLGQLITAALAELLIPGPVGGHGLGHDLPRSAQRSH